MNIGIARFALIAAAAATATATACSSSGGASPTPAPGSPHAAHTVTVLMQSGHLVGPGGRTLYSNTADTPTHLICTDSCLTIWPPVLGTPSAGSGVAQSALGTVHRGSSVQVTYQGHPLYEFSSDQKPGDTKGAGLTDAGGTWHPAGAAASPAPASKSGGGGGYGYP